MNKRDQGEEINLSPDTRIYVAGHRGMVGSAIVRMLNAKGYSNIITRSHAELELTDQHAVRDFFQTEKIDHIILSAAKVGGIHANSAYPAEFIYQNLMVQCNVIHEAFSAGINRLLFLGSSCIYPKFAPQPMKEEYLLTGPLEPTNEPYAVAKIAGIKLCESYNRQYGTQYYSVMPTNLYGPNDTYHLENSHVIPALIRKFHLAQLVTRGEIDAINRDEAIFGPIPDSLLKSLAIRRNPTTGLVETLPSASPVVQVWGTGKARREFLHVDDMSAACLLIMGLNQPHQNQHFPHLPYSWINIGSGSDVTIHEAAEIIKKVVGFQGPIIFNTDQPDGTPQKLLDTSRINALGWQPTFSIKEGLQHAYKWYCQQTANKIQESFGEAADGDI